MTLKLRSIRRFGIAPHLAAALALVLLTAACGDKARENADRPVDAKAPIGDVIGLPDNSSLVAPKGSTQRVLADFLASPEPAPGTFTFDGNQYQPWSETPSQRTRATTAALVQILRAYPRVRVMIVGYTDNVGDVAANMKLSQGRADNMRDLLKAGGVSDSHIVAIGKGPADPIGDNDTEEGRARNRRLELIVTAK